MSKMIALALAILLALVMAAPAEAASCDPRLSFEHEQLADWVFLGTVTEAKLVSETTHSIDLVLAQIEPLRGDPPSRIELKTSHGAYEPKITIGERYLAFVNSADRYVGYCRSFVPYGPEAFLRTLMLRERGDCGSDHDRKVAVAYSRDEFFSQDRPVTRAEVERMVEHWRQNTPSLVAQSGADRITVKGVSFVFAGDNLAAIEAAECDA